MKEKIGLWEAFFVVMGAIVFGSIYLYFTQSGIKVSQADLGEKWPLTVASGKVDCLKGHKVIFEATNGTIYGLNDPALKDYPGIEPIWRIDEELKQKMLENGNSSDIYFPRIPITPLREMGQTLCN